MDLIETEIDYAVLQPGARERSLMLGDSRRGSASGELLRFMWQYKSFAVTMMTTHLLRGLASNRPNRAKAQAMIDELGAADRKRRSDEARAYVASQRQALVEAGYLPAVIELRGLMNSFLEREVRSKIAESWRTRRIELIVDSPGGRVKVGEDIAKDLRELGLPIHAKAVRECSSAAVLPFISASWRTAQHGARFVLHPSAVDASGIDLRHLGAAGLRKLADKLAEFDGDYANLLERRLKLTAEQMPVVRSGDLVLNAESACAVGLIHALDDRPALRARIEASAWAKAPAAAKTAFEQANRQVR